MSRAKWVWFAVILLTMVVVQPLWGTTRIGAGRVNPYLLMTCIWGMRYGSTPGVLAGVIAGWLESTLTALTPGAYLISCGLTGQMCGVMRDLVLAPSYWLVALTVCIATIIARIIYYLIAPTGEWVDWMVGGTVEGVLNGIVSVLIWMFMNRMEKRGGSFWKTR